MFLKKIFFFKLKLYYIVVTSFALQSIASLSNFKLGRSNELISMATAICIAVGNVSLDDWDLLTWSFGCTGSFEPNFPPKSSIALLLMT